MHVLGGYKTISPIQIGNALGAYETGIIPYRTLRAYFACLTALAAREAASRCRRTRVGKEGQQVRLDELASLMVTSALSASVDVRRLERAGLIVKDRERLRVVDRVLPWTREFLEQATPKRSWSRPIPVPRRVLRLLATQSRPAVLKALLAYCIRGLSLEPETGAVKGRGTLKASWMARTFGMSLRSAKAGRAELARLGLITRDTGSNQRKLNRDGAYFEFNLAWRKPESAPRPGLAEPGSAPPIERSRTPSDLEDQEPRSAGVLAGPRLGNVQPEDLGRFNRLEVLYWQAVDRGWLGGTEMDAINFVGASFRARFGRARDPVRVFSAIVRRGLWAHITCAEEERARSALRRRREEFPGAFRERARQVEVGVRRAA